MGGLVDQATGTASEQAYHQYGNHKSFHLECHFRSWWGAGTCLLLSIFGVKAPPAPAGSRRHARQLGRTFKSSRKQTSAWASSISLGSPPRLMADSTGNGEAHAGAFQQSLAHYAALFKGARRCRSRSSGGMTGPRWPPPASAAALSRPGADPDLSAPGATSDRVGKRLSRMSRRR